MKQKSFSFLLALLMSMVANVAIAYDAEIDGIYYNFSGYEASVVRGAKKYFGDVIIPEVVTYNNLQYTVSNISCMAFYECRDMTSITIPNTVTIIESYAFHWCENLASITLPENVISIGEGVFGGCSNLSSIIIPGSVTNIGSAAFIGCEALASIQVDAGNMIYDSRNGCNAIIETSSNTLISGCMNTIIPKSVTKIGDYAFYGSGVTSIIIPKGITSIGGFAFHDCSSLASFQVEEGNTVYDSRDGCNALIQTESNRLVTGCMNTIIPESVIIIENGAFQGCIGLTSISIPNGIIYIGDCAFDGCSNLTSISIPNSVKRIGYRAFEGCESLTNIDIPNSVTAIQEYTFYGCSSLASITIPEGVTSIGNCAFMYCSDLTTAPIPNNVTSIGDYAFFGCSSLKSITIPNSIISIGKDAFYGCCGLTSITIGNGVTSISSGVFFACSGLTSVTIPSSVTSIGNSAFAQCYGLTSISIPNSVTNIGDGAFSNCYGLTSVTIPESVTSIGNYAFSGCSGLTSIRVGMRVPISISENTFNSYHGATLYIPEGSLALYESTYPWSCFENIEEYNYIDVDVENQIQIADHTATIDININNSVTNFVAFQMELSLPEGVSIDETECHISSSITDEDQKLTISRQEFGNYINYIIVYVSSNRTPISGNDDMLLTLKLTAEDGCVGGQATISNICFCTLDSQERIVAQVSNENESFDISILYKVEYMLDGEEYHTDRFVYGTEPTLINDEPTKEGYTFSGWSYLPETMPNHDVMVTGTFYLYGDVNTDEEVDVVDVVDVARYVVATPSAKFREKLADLNFDNAVNIADAVTLVNHIAGNQNFVKALAPSGLSYDYDQCQLQLLSIGQDVLSLCLDGEADFTAFQFEVDMPEGADISTICINGTRKDGHKLLYNKLADGRYRVTALSFSNAVFKGSKGELLQFSISGQDTDDICVHDIHFVSTNGKDITFDALYVRGTETGIGSIDNEMVNGKSSNGKYIFDLLGRKHSKVQHGVNIVNGKKVAVK